MSLAAVSLSEALAHEALFAPQFRGASWRRWRVFIAALFGEPLDDEGLEYFRHHTERLDETPPRPYREAAIICGRRGGKSRVLALVAVYLATFRDYTAHLAPGEIPVIAIIAATRSQARVLLNYVVGLLRETPLLAPLVVDEFAESIVLSTGVVIEIHTASIAAPRGRTFIAILADEIAFWPASEDSSNPDAEVIASVRPGLASIPNSLLLMASSPYWQRGVLWQTFRRHWGQDGARVLVWRGTTAEMNETIDPAIIAEAYEEDPVSAAAEYGAEFRTDVDTFARRQIVEAAIVRGRHELPPAKRIGYSAFVDGASGSGADRMTLAVVHADGDVGILDCLRGFAPPFSPDEVAREFSSVCKLYGVSRVCGDRWGVGLDRRAVRGVRGQLRNRREAEVGSLP